MCSVPQMHLNPDFDCDDGSHVTEFWQGLLEQLSLVRTWASGSMRRKCLNEKIFNGTTASCDKVRTMQSA